MNFATPVCVDCLRGREACEWCHDLDTIDYQTVCDCGLEDFGRHLIDCMDRAEFRWVIADARFDERLSDSNWCNRP